MLDGTSHPLMKDTIYSNLKNSQRESKVGYALFLSTAIEMNDVLADVLTISLLKPINSTLNLVPFFQSMLPQFAQQFCKRKASYHFKKTINQITDAYFRYLNSKQIILESASHKHTEFSLASLILCIVLPIWNMGSFEGHHSHWN